MKKRTKIVATISDKKCDVNFLRELYNEGMNVVRLNTAHQNREESLLVMKNVRAVSEEIALLIDTKGPEIRTLNIGEGIKVESGDQLFMKGPESDSGQNVLNVSYKDIVDDLSVER